MKTLVKCGRIEYKEVFFQQRNEHSNLFHSEIPNVKFSGSNFIRDKWKTGRENRIELRKLFSPEMQLLLALLQTYF